MKWIPEGELATQFGQLELEMTEAVKAIETGGS
jgi:hypothetical protein